MSSIKIRSKRIDGKTQIRTLISHPMETGRSRDSDNGQLIPAHYIRVLTVSLNGKVIVNCDMGASISKDPYFAFMLNGGNAGDTLTIGWQDNLGNGDSEDHIIQ
ncbi:MAG: thiosulfate oxidation carrier complex protein SoxZ [Gammaproteobacteria bacterium]